MAWINLPKTGPDSWQGIHVALKCMCVMALTAGNIRSAGVMYVGIMNHFGVSREEAAWPVSLAGAMLSLIGTVSGPLAQAFSPRPVILCGSLLIFIGLLSSVFAPSVAWLTLTFGFIFGSGLGTVYTINVIFLQQYFVKMRGLALGMNYAGSTLAGFIFPVFITFLLGQYGFQGAVLILSGVSAHIFVLCLTHREAPWLHKKLQKEGEQVESEKLEILLTETIRDESGKLPLETLEENPEETGSEKDGQTILSEPEETLPEAAGDAEVSAKVTESTSDNSGESKSALEVTENIAKMMRDITEVTSNVEEVTKTNAEVSDTLSQKPVARKIASSISVELCTASAEASAKFGGEKAKTSVQKVSLVASLSILKIPEFLVIIFSFSLFIYAYDAYFTTIIDYIVDQNIPLIQATTIIPFYSITDMVARLTVPQLGDRGYINKMLLQCLAYALQSVCFFLMPTAAATGQFFWIAALAMIQSTGIGTSIVMYGVLMAELIGISRLPMAYGIVGLFVGLTYFTKPYFVGHFRDTIGDYSPMYTVCGVLTGVASLSWLITWYLHRVTKRGRTFSNVSNKTGEQVQTSPVNAAPGVNEDSTSIGQRSRADSAVLHL